MKVKPLGSTPVKQVDAKTSGDADGPIAQGVRSSPASHNDEDVVELGATRPAPAGGITPAPAASTAGEGAAGGSSWVAVQSRAPELADQAITAAEVGGVTAVTDLERRVRASVVGAALGDATGAGVEMLGMHHLADFDLEGYHVTRPDFTGGMITDDTWQSIALVRAVMEEDQPLTVARLIDSYREAYEEETGYLKRNGYLEEGGRKLWWGSIREAFDGEKTVAQVQAKQRDREYPGNGTLMRAWSLGLLPDPEQVRSLAIIDAESTHPHKFARDGSIAIAMAAHRMTYAREVDLSGIVRQALEDVGEPETRSYLRMVDALPGYDDSDPVHVPEQTVEALCLGTRRWSDRIGIPSNALFTLGAVLFLLKHHQGDADGLRQTLHRSICMGGDVDSLATTALGILCARYGLGNLPTHLIEGILPLQTVQETAARYASFVAGKVDNRAPSTMVALLDRFPTLAEWRADLETTDRDELRETLFDIAQAIPYSPAGERASLMELVLQHPSRGNPALAEVWAEGMFRIGGPKAEAALAEHASGTTGSAESRALAEQRAQEMAAEREMITALRGGRPDAARTEALLALPLHPDFGDGEDDLRELTLTPAQLTAQLEEMGSPARRQAMIETGVAPVIATDCDGTTWKHDIGEALFAKAVEQRVLMPEAHAKLRRTLERYGLAPSDDVNDSAHTLMEAFESGELYARGERRGLGRSEVCAEFYAANLWCFAGHSVASMKAWGRELFEGDQGFKGKVFAGLTGVLDQARDNGLIPYAVSASNQWIVEVGAEYLGIPPWRVAGIRARIEDGRITTDIIDPVTYGAGKVEVVTELTGGRAAIAMGDSVDATDRELLESALLKLAVEPKASRHAFVLARGADNWRFLDYQRTLDGEAADLLELP